MLHAIFGVSLKTISVFCCIRVVRAARSRCFVGFVKQLGLSISSDESTPQRDMDNFQWALEVIVKDDGKVLRIRRAKP